MESVTADMVSVGGKTAMEETYCEELLASEDAEAGVRKLRLCAL